MSQPIPQQTTLQELPLHKSLLRALDQLGFTQATDVQAQAIPLALSGIDLKVSAKTGSGKTAAFLLPTLNTILEHHSANTGTLALILLPTRELALQTQKVFEQLAAFTPLKSGIIIGGEAFKHQVATLRKNPEVIIATPGRLVEHIERGTPDFKDLLVLILDEADRMLDMGFSEDMYTISEACNASRQNLLFSATLKHQGFKRIGALLTDPTTIIIDDHQHGHVQITQQMVFADDEKHKEKLTLGLIMGDAPKENTAMHDAVTPLAQDDNVTAKPDDAEPPKDDDPMPLAEGQHDPSNGADIAAPKQKVIIFCKTRVQCQQLGNILKYKKLKAGYIHGEVGQSARKQIMNQFRSGQINVLVATDIAARGLDIENVDLVINYTVAHSGDDHVHRIGRTGRAEQAGRAVTLVNKEDFNRMSSIERYLKIRFEQIYLAGLKAAYKGPKKLKSSGKAASTKRKPTGKTKKVRPKKKDKVINSPKDKTEQKTFMTTDDGFSSIRKKQ